jgi:formate hydrogenlyase subunit 4
LNRQHLAASSLAKWLISLCIGLLLITACIQATHLHPAGIETRDCSLCQIAASTIISLAVVLLLLVFWTTAPLHTFEDAAPVTAVASFSLFSRPPPSA